MIYLSNADVQELLDMNTCLDALRDAYADLANGDAAYIPRIDLYAPTSRQAEYYCWGSMSGLCRSAGVAAVRIKSDVMTWPDEKTQEKYCVRPGTYSGVILVYRIDNGEPVALINDGYLQHMRVGACAGLGAEIMARRDAHSVGMIGSGGMARTFLQGLAQVRPIRYVKVFSPTPEHRRSYAREMSKALGCEVEPVNSAREAANGVDILATATDAMHPTFNGEWIEPGMHVTCVTRRELNDDIVDRADVVAQLGMHSVPITCEIPGLEWPQSGVAGFVTGQPQERARLPRSHRAEQRDFPHLIDLQRDKAPGRTDDHQVTLFINGGTQGLQFAAVAGRVWRLAEEQGLGQNVPSAWFLQDIRD